AAMRLLDVEHIELISNSKQLRLSGTAWEQYIMEGSNKEDVISVGAHDFVLDPDYVLTNLAGSPAGKRMIAMAQIDKASNNYEKESAKIEELKQIMPVMTFTIDTRESSKFEGMSPVQQAGFDILWTDFVTVFTTLLRVDANSNPNVKVVRDLTASYVAKWKETTKRYLRDLIGIGKTDILLSAGYPGNEKTEAVGAKEKQKPVNAVEEAKEEGRELVKLFVKKGILKGRNRLNIFAGTDDTFSFAKKLRNETYLTRLVKEYGWIIEIGLYPGRAHKGHEATLAYSTDPEKPLLGNKSINIFLNGRFLGEDELYNEPFEDITENQAYANVNGANIHQTNDSMTFPNIQRTAQVSPTVLLEFDHSTEKIREEIKAFYEAFVEQLVEEISGDGG
ncbi:hypothetical protein KA005_72465, partial [bacterium]|nr:hypothetical protein [bacterium]